MMKKQELLAVTVPDYFNVISAIYLSILYYDDLNRQGIIDDTGKE
jgi:hypothetical protein